MERILVLDSAYPINVRNQKIIYSIRELTDHEVKFCAWLRDFKEVKESDRSNFIFTKQSHYGKRIKKLLNLLAYARFVRQSIDVFKPSIIIASHWDMLYLGSLLKPANNCTLIYENLDMPTFANPILRWVFRGIEKSALRKTDKIIFASRFFSQKYSFFKGPTLIAENKPYKTDVLPEPNHNTRKKLTITFLGTVRYFDIFKNLIEAIKDFNVELQVWGDGPDETRLREVAKDVPNIKFFGRFDYAIINTIYAATDLIWAVYPSNDYNVKFAISNKYHECLLFGKPGVFAQETHLGDLVNNKRIGFTVNPNDVRSIRLLIERIIDTPQLLQEKADNIKKDNEPHYWEDEQQKLVDFIIAL